MHALRAWSIAVVLLLGFVLTLHHLGVDVAGSLGAAFDGAVRMLGRPLSLVR